MHAAAALVLVVVADTAHHTLVSTVAWRLFTLAACIRLRTQQQQQQQQQTTTTAAAAVRMSRYIEIAILTLRLYQLLKGTNMTHFSINIFPVT